MRTYRDKAEDAKRIGRGVTVSPAWLLACLDALEPFAAMWREGDEGEDGPGELIVKRGTASDADFLTTGHVRAAGAAYRDAMKPRA